MKRLSALLLVFVLLLSGCGSTVRQEEDVQSKSPVETSTPVLDVPATDSPMEEDSSGEDNMISSQAPVTSGSSSTTPATSSSSLEGPSSQVRIDPPAEDGNPCEAETPPEEEYIYFSLEGPDGLIYSETLAYEEQSAYDLSVKSFESWGIPYKTTGFGNVQYFSSIDSYAERDYGPMSGWLYYINGESPNVGCGQYILQPNDTLAWVYFLDE